MALPIVPGLTKTSDNEASVPSMIAEILHRRNDNVEQMASDARSMLRRLGNNDGNKRVRNRARAALAVFDGDSGDD